MRVGSYESHGQLSNMSPEEYKANVKDAQEHILSGDIFQVVLSQRFERRTSVDPFHVYRALRVVNPSPYMIYLQARGSILVGASPEILARVQNGKVTNRPLAGTRRRGKTVQDDQALEEDLRNDEKEKAEHIMLVDLGRNDVGKVCKPGSVNVERLMDVERYSHVMHLSSTITGELDDKMTPWDALRAALPVGTVSGAPKVRAMQLIDEMEPDRRGPYSGGIGHVSFTGDMDIALALRTMVFQNSAAFNGSSNKWLVHVQSGAGVVADSNPESEHQECINKAAALSRAIDLAEANFVGS
jgi:anthranilate synthase component 1